MKHLYTILGFSLIASVAQAQCSSLSISISSSDTGYVQLYHAGLFLLDSGHANVCFWEASTLDGTIIHQDTTSGNFEDQSFSLFEHEVPISDSIMVSLVIQNPITGSSCSIMDVLVWQETEVLPGSFIGNWAILNGNVGSPTGIVESRVPSFQLHPSPATDHLRITGMEGPVTLRILDGRGALVATQRSVSAYEQVDVSRLRPGMYTLQLFNDRGLAIGYARFVKD